MQKLSELQYMPTYIYKNICNTFYLDTLLQGIHHVMRQLLRQMLKLEQVQCDIIKTLSEEYLHFSTWYKRAISRSLLYYSGRKTHGRKKRHNLFSVLGLFHIGDPLHNTVMFLEIIH